MEPIIQGAREKMKKSIEAFRGDLTGIRSGRASAGLVEGVKVDYYGNQTPLKGVATITVPDAKTIAIVPWDKGMLSAIEGAVRDSELNLNPTNDGNAVRINLPALTEERRKELIKVVHDRAEDAKVSLRNARHEAMDEVKKGFEAKSLTEDDKFKAEEQLNKLIDEMNKEVEGLTEQKEKEMLEV